jgi:hypothetical protein
VVGALRARRPRDWCGVVALGSVYGDHYPLGGGVRAVRDITEPGGAMLRFSWTEWRGVHHRGARRVVQLATGKSTGRLTESSGGGLFNVAIVPEGRQDINLCAIRQVLAHGSAETVNIKLMSMSSTTDTPKNLRRGGA